MQTRMHVHEEVLPAASEEVFALLCTPSAIRSWWSAPRAIVVPERGGIWAAAWGGVEDRPEYVTVATVREFHPPHRLVLSDYRYWAEAGPPPFRAEFVTEFLVSPNDQGATGSPAPRRWTNSTLHAKGLARHVCRDQKVSRSEVRQCLTRQSTYTARLEKCSKVASRAAPGRRLPPRGAGGRLG